jgi:hypothetical protein
MSFGPPDPEEQCTIILRNVGNYLPTDTVQHPRTLESSKNYVFCGIKRFTCSTHKTEHKFSAIPLLSSSSESDISSSDSPESETTSGSDSSLPAPASSS